MSLLSLVFPLLSFACGGWGAADIGKKASIGFSAGGGTVQVTTPSLRLKKAIWTGDRAVYFSNGDRAHWKDGVITYWHGMSTDAAGKRKWKKRKIGKVENDSFTLDGLGTLRRRVVDRGKMGSSPWARMELTNEKDEIVIRFTPQSQCTSENRSDEEKVESEAKRIVGYLVWKSQEPDLSKGPVDRWWW